MIKDKIFSIEIIKSLLPTPSLSLPKYDTKNKSQWVKKVISLISGFKYYENLLTSKDKLATVVPSHAKTANKNLYI